jgi:hypothetical protein
MITKHRKFFLFTFSAILGLVILWVYFFALSGELENLKQEFDELSDDSINVQNGLFLDNSLEGDLSLALTENKYLLEHFKSHLNYWDDFLNPPENVFIAHKSQSASGVNAYLSRLLPNLKNRCFTNGVQLKVPDSQTFGDESAKGKEFGFGFSAYRGFWPSFDKSEASLIEIQAKIVNQIVDTLASSTADGQMLELEFIKREAVGSTDKKHIGTDIVGSMSNSLLLRSSNLVKSYRFQVSFIGRTENARSFINQLRLPLCVRKIEALRESEILESVTSNFDEPDPSKADDIPESDILPIIRDIKTRFIIDLEYVYEILYKQSDFIELSNMLNVNQDSYLEILEKFKAK